jgi:hypothetical protein
MAKKIKHSQLVEVAYQNAVNRGADVMQVANAYVPSDGGNQFDSFEEAFILGQKLQIDEQLFTIGDGDGNCYYFLGKEADVVTKLNQA